VEDRLTPDLWLEMSDLPADRYTDEQLPRVGATQGVERATSFANAHPHRRDLPRRVDEFATLGVFELGADADGERTAAAAPAPAAGVTRMRFRRTPRPGQGVLTGKPTIGLFLILISPRSPEEGQALRDWADFTHIRHIAAAAVPGFSMITPYERAEPDFTDGPARYLHLYEIDGEDPEAVYRGMIPLVAGRIGEPGSPAFDTWAGHPTLRIDYVNTFRRCGTWPA
jgi:hypothetical protein